MSTTNVRKLMNCGGEWGGTWIWSGTRLGCAEHGWADLEGWTMADGAGSEGVSMGGVSKKAEAERDQVWQESQVAASGAVSV